jgi:hypothetical protein
MRRPSVHRPNPRPRAEQDKQTVAPIEIDDVGQWLSGTVEQVAGLVRVLRVEVLAAGPVG